MAIAKMAGTLRAKRGDIVNNGILAARAQFFCRGIIKEMFFAYETMRGVNQVA